MAIDSPETYGDYYWAMQVEAAKMFDESIEQAVSPYFAGLLGELPDFSEKWPGIQGFIRGLTEPPSPGMGGLLTSAAGEFSAELLKGMLDPAAKMMRRHINRRSLETWLSASQAMQLKQHHNIDETYFNLIMASEGYEDVIRDQVYRSSFPYPSIADLMVYARYHGDPDNVRGVVWEHYDLPPDMFDVWQWQTAQRITTEQTQNLFKRGVYSEGDLFQELAQIGWSEQDRSMLRDLSYSIPNAMLLVQGGLVQETPTENILEQISKADIHPDYAQTYLDAILTKPATIDLVAYELRKDPQLSDLERKLTKIGIHPDYIDVYKTLANPIPPVADLVTMAVREAFTPSIAAKFGQYEDFPPDFEEWAGKKGVSSDWAKRYWASHWSLPSATQGFSMLHRGIIDQTELNMLLRALDVMPYWRDKLVKVAYRPLTRVDVRRMYKEGILDEKGVYEAYLDHGYNDKNAQAMTDFTVQYVLTQQTKFTTKDVISAYSKRMITVAVARGLLGELGVRSENISFVISTADYKRQWEFTDERIKGIKNMYRRKVYDDDKAKSELLKLNVATEQVEVLMQQWWYEVKEEPTQNWTTAQTLLFMSRGLITESRGRKELTELGYDREHIDIYLGNLQWIPPKK